MNNAFFGVDNCLVTDTWCENLSAGIPRSVEAIEKAMGKAGL